MSLVTAKRALTNQIERGQPQPIANPTKLPIDVIGELPEVFQHRMPLEHQSSYHVKELAKALRSGQPLTAITVFWAGTGWLCVDGHHRLNAYRSAGWKKNIPVFAFTGTLDQAINRAAMNTYDKLPMHRGEKANAAWRLVVATSLSKAKIVHSTSVSDGSVAHMRRVFKTLEAREPGRDLSELVWEDARRESSGQEKAEVDWESQIQVEAQQFANTLAKAFGKRAHLRLEAFANALEIYNPRLRPFLSDYWSGDAGAFPNPSIEDEF
ncbi:MAG: ParB/Srx family N-terminal domain-containing protein [Burkholderiales bacterium]|nr:ParB/Srx family N-terminal domain-containing protein [Burkholderiales bacterium]